MATEFKLPNLGENIESGDVLKVLVSAGDKIEKEQTVVELETDKAAIEVPSPVSGIVSAVHVHEGEKAAVGQLILTVETDGAAEDAAPSGPPEAPSPPLPPPEAVKPQAEPPEAEEAPPEPPEAEVETPAPPDNGEGVSVAATPSVRRLAREIGVDLRAVKGTGRGGRISVADVKAHAKSALQGRGAAAPAPAPPPLSRSRISQSGERSSAGPCPASGARRPRTCPGHGRRSPT